MDAVAHNGWCPYSSAVWVAYVEVALLRLQASSLDSQTQAGSTWSKNFTLNAGGGYFPRSFGTAGALVTSRS